MSSDQKKKKSHSQKDSQQNFPFNQWKFPNSCKACVTLTQTSKHTTRKGNYRLVFLINIDVKIFNKVLADWILAFMKKITHPAQVGSILETQ